MKSNLIKKSILALALTFILTPKNYAQSDDLNFINFQTISLLSNNDITTYDGELTLITNEVVKGKISLNHQKGERYETLLETEKGFAYIDNQKINSIKLTSTINNIKSETSFVKLQKGDKFYRELYKKDESNAIYDTLEQPFDQKTIDDVFILESNQLVSIDNFWSSGPKKDIINYLNKRDDTKYKRKDFKTLNELFTLL